MTNIEEFDKRYVSILFNSLLLKYYFCFRFMVANRLFKSDRTFDEVIDEKYFLY